MGDEVEQTAITGDRTVSMLSIAALTCSAGGLQLIWSTMFSHGSAYLFSLGITKAQSSLVWAIAPLCGTLVPPIVGALSDNCRLRCGRRRPFIVGGAVCAVLCMLTLAWIKDITLILHLARIEFFAIVLIVLLNIAVQTLQLSIRALAVDTVPPEQQITTSAWISRFIGIGNMIGYFVASLPISATASEQETSRFRLMTGVAATAVICTVAVTTTQTNERRRHSEVFKQGPSGRHLSSTWRKFLDAAQDMPSGAKWICKVQFFSCMAWFGFLFYSSTYVSGLFLGERREGITIPLGIQLDSMAVGSSANLAFAIVAFATSVLLPWILESPSQSSDSKPASNEALSSPVLPTIWGIGNLLYSAAVLATIFITYSSCGIILIGLVGVSWGIQQWIPFALISAEISSHQALLRAYSSLEAGNKSSREVLNTDSAAMMGLHSAAMSSSQILAALLTSGVFKIAKELGHEDHSVGWALRISAGATLVAAWFIFRRVRM